MTRKKCQHIHNSSFYIYLVSQLHVSKAAVFSLAGYLETEGPVQGPVTRRPRVIAAGFGRL